MSSPQLPDRNTHKVSPLELQTKVDEDLTIKEKAPTRAFSWLKVATTACTFKNSSSQFHVYLPWVNARLVSIVS